jgi:hypothetical protein
VTVIAEVAGGQQEGSLCGSFVSIKGISSDNTRLSNDPKLFKQLNLSPLLLKAIRILYISLQTVRHSLPRLTMVPWPEAYGPYPQSVPLNFILQLSPP